MFGRDDNLLYCLMEDHYRNNRLEPFIGKLILKDMKALRWFYEGAARRNFKIRNKLYLEDPLIPQDKLDNYLVKLAFGA